jgi:hypothetical protein
VAQLGPDRDARAHEHAQRDHVEPQQDHRQQQEQAHGGKARAGAEVQPDDRGHRLDRDPRRHGSQ